MIFKKIGALLLMYQTHSSQKLGIYIAPVTMLSLSIEIAARLRASLLAHPTTTSIVI
jgi:hypothetical protein